MKKLLFLLLFHFIVLSAWADHLVGGELFYTYKGISASNHPVYTVTLRFFRNMHSSVPSIGNEPIYIGVYQKHTTLIKTITLPFQKVDTLKSIDFPACVSTSLQTIYEVGYFSADVELPADNIGYTLAWIRCCRTNAVNNMNLNDGGITLTSIIPGTSLVQDQPNNSAIFPLRDTVLLCNDQSFELNFGAADADKDSLSYEFYPALNGASLFDPTPQPNASIVIEKLKYKEPAFTADKPMGASVTIDPVTGSITGVAPAAGTYLLTARVYEWRNGKMINEHSKDILVKVKNCSYSVAQLKPEYIYCDSLVGFKNEALEKVGDTYHWDFGVPNTTADISDLQRPQYKYTVAGEYNVTLVINKDKPCPAKATTKVKVYPGLKTGFIVKDSCAKATIQFTDTASYSSGTINQWQWDFGEPLSPSNTSRIQNPVHRYTSSGNKTIKLIVGTNNGCYDTSYRQLDVLPLPALPHLEESITICKGDTAVLRTGGSGTFAWTPVGQLSDATAGDPFVYPFVTTRYHVMVKDANCSNTDSVLVNVLPRDAVQIQNVVPFCEGDTLKLNAQSNATVLQWLPQTYISDSKIAAPFVYPPQTTVYKVIANPGQCQTEDDVEIRVLDRPLVDAGSDIIAKEEQLLQLNASGAANYQWTPRSFLSNEAIGNPLLKVPVGIDSLMYVIEGRFTNGCSDKDTLIVYVNVLPFVDAPSAFTPNEDSKNDVFRPIIKGGYELEEFVVFNRWGQQLFQTTSLQKGWNGYTGNIANTSGVYVWMTRAINKTTKAVVVQKGTVMLIR